MYCGHMLDTLRAPYIFPHEIHILALIEVLNKIALYNMWKLCEMSTRD